MQALSRNEKANDIQSRLIYSGQSIHAAFGLVEKMVVQLNPAPNVSKSLRKPEYSTPQVSIVRQFCSFLKTGTNRPIQVPVRTPLDIGAR